MCSCRLGQRGPWERVAGRSQALSDARAVCVDRASRWDWIATFLIWLLGEWWSHSYVEEFRKKNPDFCFVSGVEGRR